MDYMGFRTIFFWIYRRVKVYRKMWISHGLPWMNYIQVLPGSSMFSTSTFVCRRLAVVLSHIPCSLKRYDISRGFRSHGGTPVARKGWLIYHGFMMTRGSHRRTKRKAPPLIETRDPPDFHLCSWLILGGGFRTMQCSNPLVGDCSFLKVCVSTMFIQCIGDGQNPWSDINRMAARRQSVF